MPAFANSPADRRYLRRMLAANAVYLVSLFLCKYTLIHLHPAPAITVVLAIIPSIASVAIIAVLALYLKEEKDEFQRELTVQALLWSTGITLAFTSSWGFLELFSNAPHIPQFYVFVCFSLVFAVSTAAVRLRYHFAR